jgi:hypothetical protein
MIKRTRIVATGCGVGVSVAAGCWVEVSVANDCGVEVAVASGSGVTVSATVVGLGVAVATAGTGVLAGMAAGPAQPIRVVSSPPTRSNGMAFLMETSPPQVTVT